MRTLPNAPKPVLRDPHVGSLGFHILGHVQKMLQRMNMLDGKFNMLLKMVVVGRGGAAGGVAPGSQRFPQEGSLH